MTVVKIEPVAVRTVGGHDAIVDGIDLAPSDGDFFRGTVTSDKSGTHSTRWNSAGICRDSPHSCNLSVSSEEFFDLLASARQLGLSS